MGKQGSLWVDWFSLEWFYPETLLSYHWDHGIILYALPLLPFLFVLRWLFHLKFRQRFEVALTAGQRRQMSVVALLRFIPPILFLLSLILVVVALARPQRSDEKVETYAQGINIMFAMDVSESMLIEDFIPNRLEASKEILREFVGMRPDDRIGIVAFAGAAYTVVPLTTDNSLLLQTIAMIDPGLIDSGATAIGNALGVCINRLNAVTNESKVIVLLTDGENTEGNLGPESAALLAYAYNIKLYVIGIGTEGQVPLGKDPAGRQMYVTSSLNEPSMKKIASIAKGRYFKAQTSTMLAEVLKSIAQLHTTKIRETRFKDTKDFYQVYLVWAMVFFVLWMLTKSTFLSSALDD